MEAAAAEGEGGGCVGGAEGRRGAYAGPLPPEPHPRPSPPSPITPPSSALCAIAHLGLEARVGSRLEQRLDAGSAAAESRVVQRRPLVVASGIKLGSLGDEELG